MSDADVPGATWPAPPIVLRLSLLEVTSLIIVSNRRRVTRTGSPAELDKHYRTVQAHNWTAGWWGIPMGVIWTPWALSRNRKAHATMLELAKKGTASAAWFPDPSGRHTKRYWDGERWTDRVSDETTDDSPAT